MRNIQPEYWQLLAVAYDTGEAVDMFDLHEDDPASAKEWERLCAQSADAQHDLVEFIVCNRGELQRLFRGMNRDRGSKPVRAETLCVSVHESPGAAGNRPSSSAQPSPEPTP